MKQRTAIKLDRGLLDALVGRYEVAPCAVLPSGQKLTIWREEDQLRAKFSVGDQITPALVVYPASETNFFFNLDAFGELFLVKDEKGQVTAVIRRFGVGGGLSDCLAKKLADLSK
jgi:hypothetical protein